MMSTQMRTQTRSDASQFVVVALLVGLLGGLTLLGSSSAAAQGMSGSEASIEQVNTPDLSTTIATAPQVSKGPFLQTVLGPFRDAGSGRRVLSESVRGDVTGQQVVLRQDGRGNTASVDQRDASNVAAILQRGNLNETRVVQRGRSNTAGVVIDGDNNSLEVLQRGNSNRYLLEFRGNDLGRPGTRTVLQSGSNNLLVEVGRTGIPFNIQQNGDGMRMIIRHSGGQ